ncbi:MAG: hypothetical protein CVU97_01410 [Firmicutes bacterium HGW-Firmicutes-21]|nr:MAG: hypothetical protein CVU97_01410 [Firmicutes bacterium HGW-Firmicutes-21]
MKRKIALLLSFVLLMAFTVLLPVQAAGNVYNLIDENGSTWEQKAANNNEVALNFTSGKLVATAPGAWPYVTGTFKTPITVSKDDNPVLNIKFKVEDESACASIRLIAGTQAIFIHHFIDGAEYDGSGDIKAGEYELSVKLFDLKAYNGTAADIYLGKKDLVLDTGNSLTFDKFQVWCAGASTDITVTIEKFEIVIPAEEESATNESVSSETGSAVSTSSEQSGAVSTSSHQSVASSQSSVSEPVQTGDMGLFGGIAIAIVSIVSAAIIVKKRRA